MGTCNDEGIALMKLSGPTDGSQESGVSPEGSQVDEEHIVPRLLDHGPALGPMQVRMVTMEDETAGVLHVERIAGSVQIHGPSLFPGYWLFATPEGDSSVGRLTAQPHSTVKYCRFGKLGIYTPKAHMEHEEDGGDKATPADADSQPRHLYLDGRSDGRLETSSGVSLARKKGLRNSMRKLSITRNLSSGSLGAGAAAKQPGAGQPKIASVPEEPKSQSCQIQ